MPKTKCAVRREKPKRHLGRYAGGGSWEKCGRVATHLSENGVPTCATCAATRGMLAFTPLGAVSRV